MKNHLYMWKNKQDWPHHHPFYRSWWWSEIRASKAQQRADDDCDNRPQGHSQCSKMVAGSDRFGAPQHYRKNHNLWHTSKEPNKMQPLLNTTKPEERFTNIHTKIHERSMLRKSFWLLLVSDCFSMAINRKGGSWKVNKIQYKLKCVKSQLKS